MHITYVHNTYVLFDNAGANDECLWAVLDAQFPQFADRLSDNAPNWTVVSSRWVIKNK